MSLSSEVELALAPTADLAWRLDECDCDQLRESSRESRFAVSNGFLGVRGTRAINQAGLWSFPPRTYVAGLFDTLSAQGPPSVLVPAADWLQIRILLSGGPLAHGSCDMLPRCMTLDMKRGALLTQCRPSDGSAVSVSLRSLHLVSMSERALGLQLIELRFENGEANVTFEASFEGMNLGLLPERIEQHIGVWSTKRSGKRLGIAFASSLQVDGREHAPTALSQFKCSWNWKSQPGQLVFFERLVAMKRSDTQALDPGSDARDKLCVARRLGWRNVLAEHEAAWASRWQCSDVTIEGDAPAQQALRFAVYHLNSAADPTDERVSIGARALTGDDYHGHVFWDTEIFLLPFYIMTWPQAARALLMYRFHTLDAARAKAAGKGWRGALYAWESADSGEEVTPKQAIAPDRRVIDIFTGQWEQHISADVAYAIWQYWQATGDEEFLLDAGAEILLETGRFWASRAQPGADGYHHIRGVIGPDEYHERIDDNAFTNIMARWNIRRALDVAALLRERWAQRWASLSQSLGLDDIELSQWRNVAETMATGLDLATGLFEQFAGFFALEEINLADYAGRSVPMDVVLGRQRTQRSQVIKQADVVALLALLPEEFVGQTAAANFRYYEPRCGHGSSLSRAMHALAASRLGYTDVALRYFKESAAIDLRDTHAAITGGVHIGALGGVWLTAVFGFAGLSLQSDSIAVDPKLPPTWRSLAFSVHWRGRRLKIRIDQAKQLLQAKLEAGESMTIFVKGKPHGLSRAAVADATF